MKKILITLFAFLSMRGLASADMSYTPMLTSGAFTGVTTDVVTCATGIISVVLVILGVSYIVRMLVR